MKQDVKTLTFYPHFFTASLPHIWVINMNKGSTKQRIAVFASGTGTNAQKIIEHFSSHPTISVDLIVCNKTGAGVLGIAQKFEIPSLLIDKQKFEKDGYVIELKQYNIHFIVLAGFLWKIPPILIQAFQNSMINIHPALLPKYGGKGMYGARVHETVLQAREIESGITIHIVDEHYDHGKVIFQATCPVFTADTAETLSTRIHTLEHAHYPRVIEEILEKRNSNE